MKTFWADSMGPLGDREVAHQFHAHDVSLPFVGHLVRCFLLVMDKLQRRVLQKKIDFLQQMNQLVDLGQDKRTKKQGKIKRERSYRRRRPYEHN